MRATERSDAGKIRPTGGSLDSPRMARSVRYLLAAVIGVAGVLTLASCGGEDAQLLPGETAREITTNLDAVQQLADEGDCVGSESAAQQVSEQIEALAGVDPKLKEALEDGAVRLNEVVAACEEEETETERPRRVPTETEETTEKEPIEEEDKEREKEEREEEKERAKEEKEEEKEEPPVPAPPSEPPGLEEEGEEGESEGESPSGGVSPGNAVEGSK